jgi:hypothetical protein
MVYMAAVVMHSGRAESSCCPGYDQVLHHIVLLSPPSTTLTLAMVECTVGSRCSSSAAALPLHPGPCSPSATAPAAVASPPPCLFFAAGLPSFALESGIETAYNQRVVLWSIPALMVLRT